MKISLIAAIGKNNEIGKNNDLLWSLPDDLRHFKEKTLNKTIVMGQKTFESLGKPLPNRRNIIMTLDQEFSAPGAEVVHSREELEGILQATDSDEVFIIGGGQIYRLFIDSADKLYLTEVEAEFPKADTFFPPVDKTKWKLTKKDPHPKDARHEYDFAFCEYEKV